MSHHLNALPRLSEVTDSNEKLKYRQPGLTRANEIPTGLKHFDELPDSALVDQPVVEGAFKCSSATVWRWVKSGLLPQPIRRGRTTRWRVGDLRILLEGGV